VKAFSKSDIYTLPVKTGDGVFVARYSDTGLCALSFPSSKMPDRARQPAPTAQIRQWHALTCQAVKAVLAGRTPLELPPFDLREGTHFQRRVWEELAWTPTGETRSYADIARALRRPNAARAVGSACGANPIPLLIPCHRVLAANGRIGGFSGGLNWKRRLLEVEGVTPAR
jgi:O-6-methylguanine DNA methyltransferase